MKKVLLNLAILASISLAATACLDLGKDDETGGDPSSFAVGTMSAKVDGSAWESKPLYGNATSFAAVTNEVLTITGSAFSGTTVSNINITVTGYTGPGTYTFGISASDDYAYGIYIEGSVSAQTVHLAGAESGSDESLGSGEIVISSEEEVDGKKVVTGTFKFTTGYSSQNNVEIENAAIEITNGAFKLTSAI